MPDDTLMAPGRTLNCNEFFQLDGKLYCGLACLEKIASLEAEVARLKALLETPTVGKNLDS